MKWRCAYQIMSAQLRDCLAGAMVGEVWGCVGSIVHTVLLVSKALQASPFAPTRIFLGVDNIIENQCFEG